MMFTFNQVMILLLFAVVIVLLGNLVGGWLMYKGKNAVQGEGFMSGPPKGAVFSIPDAEALEENETEKNILDRSKDFLKLFGGSDHGA